MAFMSKVLAQSTPGPALTAVYQAPAGTSTTLSVIICNRGIFADKYRIAIAVGGEADNPKQYLYYDTVIPANSTDTVSNLFLRAGDVLRIWASISDISFNVLGIESN